MFVSVAVAALICTGNALLEKASSGFLEGVGDMLRGAPVAETVANDASEKG